MKKRLLVLCLYVFFGSGCAGTLTPQSQPGDMITSTLNQTLPTITPPAAATPSDGMYLSGIDMMDESSGWTWAEDPAYQSYLLHTSDGGETWVDVTPPKEMGLERLSSYSSFFLDAQTAWIVVSGDKLAHTSDGGKTWQAINENLMDELVWPFRDWYRFRFSDVLHGRLVAGYTAAGAHEFYYETQDGGATWEPMNFETLPGNYFDNGSAKNELAFWTTIDVIYYDDTKFIIAPGEQEGTSDLFLSNDWGNTWKTISLPATILNDLSDASFGRQIQSPEFFGEEGVLPVKFWNRDTEDVQMLLFGTVNGGLTWTLDGGPFVIQNSKVDIVFPSRHELLYVCGVNLCRSNDSGSTWQKLNFGYFTPVDPDHVYFQLNFIDSLTGWVLLYTLDAQGYIINFRLLKTTDGGNSWQEIVPVMNR